MPLDVVNPATGETLKTSDEMTPQQTAAAIEEAHAAWTSWRKVPFSERARPMKKAAAILRARKEEFANLMTVEMGKPFKQGVAEAEKCALGCDYYADHAEASRARDDQDGRGEIRRAFEPHRCRARRHAVELSLLAGIPVCGARADGRQRRRAEARVERAGLRARDRGGVRARPDSRKASSRTLLIGSRGGEAVIEDPRVCAVTLTGSTPAGKAVAAQAGAALKKTVLELGGCGSLHRSRRCRPRLAVNTCATRA